MIGKQALLSLWSNNLKNQQMQHFTSFSLLQASSLSYIRSCFMNPLLGQTMLRFSFNRLTASFALSFIEFMRQDATIVALLDTPALQCTSTLCSFISAWMNLEAESKKHLMFSEGSSAINILKCLMSAGSFSSASPITVITAFIPFSRRMSAFCAKSMLPRARPYFFPFSAGSMIQ